MGSELTVQSGYEVVAVRYGRLVTTRADGYLNHHDYHEPDGPLEFAYDFWVVRDDDRTVVVDTGFDPIVGARRGRELLVDPRAAIAALDVPDDATTTVVVSHAHYDHIGNLGMFRRARVVMARAEYDFWVAHPRAQHLTRQLVEPGELDLLRRLREEGRLELIDAPLDLAPGIRLLPAPGHTPGELMVLVETPAGGVLLTADAVHFDEELRRRMPFRHMCDIVAAADSYDAIDALRASGAASRVIAGHEPAYRDQFPPHPRLPEHAFILSAAL
jgi:glyoxylase-like metal-dependent hydrolase (beta-lactamase superfamily II)